MAITNKDLDDKLDKIHERINKLFERTTQLVEHVKTQNGRIGKCETNIEGLDGTLREHEGEINDACAKIDGHLKSESKTEKRGWDAKMIRFGGMMSLATGITVGMILLIARLFLGI
jgi:uncharacterized coiled-coil DUF342 family protein